MASAPLNWLLKIGGATLKTTAKTLSEAVNTLHDTVTNLGTTVTNLGTTVTNLGTSKADASTTTTALNNLETNKLNISDLLSLEEIEASTSLTGKGVTAESIKSLNNSLIADNAQQFQFAYDSESGKYGYKAKVEGADTFFPFRNKAEIEQLDSLSGDGITNAFTINNALDYSFFFVVYQYDTSGDYGLSATNGTVLKMFGWHPVYDQYVAGFIVTPTNDICTIDCYFDKRIIYGVK